MDTVVAIYYYDVNSYDATRRFRAVAVDEDAARRWIQDEVDGKHPDSGYYTKGKTADWWILYGTFKLARVPLFN